MPAIIDRVGIRYGRLLVTKMASLRDNAGRILWECDCDCGAKKVASGSSLVTGKVKSCGCYRSDFSAKLGRENSLRHGMFGTTEYKIWQGIKQRCLNKNSRDFARYGGRGIKMHESWQNDFMEFHKYMGSRPPGTSIDRIDNNGKLS